jgi:hypothetical protein
MKLHIVLRTHDGKNIHGQRRRYIQVSKRELVIGCVSSLVNSANHVSNHSINFTILDDHSTEELINSLKNIFSQSIHSWELIHLKEKGFNTKQIAECIDRDVTQVSIKIKRLGKMNKTYNDPHRAEKYATNARFIIDANIDRVLDVFSGSKSAYETYVLKKLVTNDAEVSFSADYNYDALTFCCMQYAGGNKYDLVDLDPFGSAYDCFDLAIKMAKKGLIITLGELGHKRFKRLDFVRRYYGIETLEDFTTDNLVKHIIKIGERNKKTLIPIYVKDWRNIARVYFKIEQLKITEQWETKN